MDEKEERNESKGDNKYFPRAKARKDQISPKCPKLMGISWCGQRQKMKSG
jgi:hypothetical protein